MNYRDDQERRELLRRSRQLYAHATRYRSARPAVACDGSPLTIGKTPAKKVAVFSHERSGTHFLMNALSLNFGYLSDPWWNLDFEEGVNFHAPGFTLGYLEGVRDIPVQNILKSHHAAGFIDDILEPLREQFHLLYIHRDPRQVMPSFWRLIRDFPWDEGPRTKTVRAFIDHAPRANMLRYQKEQARDVLHRWQMHVEGWRDLIDRSDGAILCLRFEDLDQRFDETVRRIGSHLGQTIDTPRRPGADAPVVRRSRADDRPECDAETNRIIAARVGPTLDRLGYAREEADLLER